MPPAAILHPMRAKVVLTADVLRCVVACDLRVGR
jgi:hypothetical protein